MADVITILENNRVITEVAGADILLPMAIAASAENADRAEQAYQDILEVASGAPDAPSILNKLNKDGDNADPGLLSNIGAVGSVDLAAADGSELVGFQQVAAGSVTRNAQSKMREVVSLADFGGRPGASFDNTGAFNKAQSVASTIIVPWTGQWKANIIMAKDGIKLVGSGGRAEYNGADSLEPFDMTKPALTLGDGVNQYRDMQVDNLHVSGTVDGVLAPQAVLIKGGVINAQINQPVFYGGLITYEELPSATQPVTGVKKFGGSIRNDESVSGSRCYKMTFVTNAAFATDNPFFGTKFNKTAGGKLWELDSCKGEFYGCYTDFIPGAHPMFTNGGFAWGFGSNLDPGATGVVIAEATSTVSDITAILNGNWYFAGQKWKDPSGEYTVPADVNILSRKSLQRDAYLLGALYFGTTADSFSTTISLSPLTDTGPIALDGAAFAALSTEQAVGLQSGALQSYGGLSVSKDAYIGGNFFIYGGNGAPAGYISASAGAGGLFLEAIGAGQDIQLVAATGGYTRIRNGLGIRTHDDNAQANGITGNAWAYTTSYAYRDGAGTKVVGAQAEAVADATDSASVITQLNLLLSRLRAHGLIAA